MNSIGHATEDNASDTGGDKSVEGSHAENQPAVEKGGFGRQFRAFFGIDFLTLSPLSLGRTVLILAAFSLVTVEKMR